jgi:ubiquinone/menaquinone biosynthesis C-methylase UbiE
MKKAHGTTIIVTENVREYRATIPKCISKGDIVLEIGCAEGTTTKRLSEHCREVIGIDKGKSLPKAKERYPWLRFEQIDGFDISSLLKLGKQFNKIYIDISGSRDLADVLLMIRKHEIVFKPELIVVKSNKLKKMLRKCRIWQDYSGEEV